MDKKREIWMDSVLRSMEGNTRVKPRAHLFDQIEQKLDLNQIELKSSKVSWLNIAAIGAILLAANAYCLTQVDTFRTTDSELVYNEEETEGYSLVTNYKLYE